jgi:hypothetical protein
MEVDDIVQASSVDLGNVICDAELSGEPAVGGINGEGHEHEEQYSLQLLLAALHDEDGHQSCHDEPEGGVRMNAPRQDPVSVYHVAPL